MRNHSGESIHPSRSTARWQSSVRRLLFVAVSVGGLMCIGQATAQEAAAAASGQTAATGVQGKSGKVCRSEDVTGSRMKKRVCYTPEQWEERERAARELVRELDGKSIPKDANGG